MRATFGLLSRNALLVYHAQIGDGRGPISPLAQQTIRKMIIDELRWLGRFGVGQIRSDLWQSAKKGIQLGARSTGLESEVRGATPLDIRWALNSLGQGVREDLAAARRLARHGKLDNLADLQTMLAAARKAGLRVDRTATWVAHRAVNEGVRRAVDAADVAAYWQPERDACLTCLAYAGRVVQPGEMFPAGLTFGGTSTVTEPIAGPPAHPNCRCQLEPWLGSEIPGFDITDSIRREAQRSVLTGTAGGSEPARLRAADRLLSSVELLVPRTVQKRARAAVRAGRFTDRRRPT